jgi:hypothetical protein
MIVRLLNRCGLYLGREKDLLPPAPDNPEGFWEHKAFVRLNDALLTRLGGHWDRPPPESAGWEEGPAFRRPHADGSRLVRRFRGREPWGWKDPRNCLTLPFWRKLLPAMKVLLCLRNPAAVARSLGARDGTSCARSFDLWLTYNRRVLAAVPAANRVVTHYDRYLEDPQAELRRVLDRLGIAATDDCLEQACAGVKLSLAHHRTTVDDLVAGGGSPGLVRCYLALCTEAGSAGLPRKGERAPAFAR